MCVSALWSQCVVWEWLEAREQRADSSRMRVLRCACVVPLLLLSSCSQVYKARPHCAAGALRHA